MAKESQENCTYIFFNENTQEAYIGSTSNDRRRYLQHMSDLSKNSHHSWKLQRAYNKDPNFDFHVVPMENRQDAASLEQILIDENYGNPKLLNVSTNVDAPMFGRNHSEETRLLMSKIQKEQYNKGRVPHMLGKTLSEETVQKISLATTGLKRTEESKERIRLSQLGKTLTDEQKQAISIRGIERMKDPEVREKCRLSMLGNKHGVGRIVSEETRNKLSEAGKGRIVPEETRLAISNGKKGKTFTDEHRENIRISRIGTKQSPETIDKRFESMRVPVCINGVRYKSIPDASKKLDISKSTIYHRVKNKSEEFKNYTKDSK